MHVEPAQIKAMVDFLVDAFTAEEWRRFLSYTEARGLLPRIPQGGGAAQIVHESVEVFLRDRGILDKPQFFIALLQERPNRQAEAREVFRPFLGARVDWPVHLATRLDIFRRSVPAAEVAELTVQINTAWQRILAQIKVTASYELARGVLLQSRLAETICRVGEDSPPEDVAHAQALSNRMVDSIAALAGSWAAELVEARGGGVGKVLVGPGSRLYPTFENVVLAVDGGDLETALLQRLGEGVRAMLNVREWVSGRMNRVVTQGWIEDLGALYRQVDPQKGPDDAAARVPELLPLLAEGFATAVHENLRIEATLEKECGQALSTVAHSMRAGAAAAAAAEARAQEARHAYESLLARIARLETSTGLQTADLGDRIVVLRRDLDAISKGLEHTAPKAPAIPVEPPPQATPGLASCRVGFTIAFVVAACAGTLSAWRVSARLDELTTRLDNTEGHVDNIRGDIEIVTCLEAATCGDDPARGEEATRRCIELKKRCDAR